MALKKKYNTVLFRLTTSYIVLGTLLILLIWIATQSYYIRKYDEKTVTYNIAFLEHIKSSIEESVVNPTINIALALAVETINTSDLHYFFDHSPSDDYGKIFRANKYLESLATTNQFVDSIHVFYEHDHFVISSSSGLSYLDSKTSSYPEYEELKQLSKTNKGLWTYSIDSYSQDGDDSPQLTYIHNITYLRDHTPYQGYIGITLKTNAINDILDNMASNVISNFYLLDQQNIVLAYTESSSASEMQQNNVLTEDITATVENLQKDKGHIKYDSSMGESVVSFNTIDITKWRLVSISLQTDFYDESTHLKMVFFAILFFVLGLGIIISIFLSYRMYMPIKKIMNSIKGNLIFRTENTALEGNEYAIIDETLNQIIHKVTDLETTLRQNQPIIKHNFILSLIEPLHIERHIYEEGLDMLNKPFNMPYFQCIIIDLEQKLMNSHAIRQQLYIKYQIIDYVDNFHSDNLSTLITSIDSHRLILVANLPSKDTHEQHDLLKSIKRFAFESYGISMFIVMSDYLNDIMYIHQSFKKMQLYQDYSYFITDQQVLFATDFYGPYMSDLHFESLVDKFNKALRSRSHKDVEEYLSRMIYELKTFCYSPSRSNNNLLLILRCLVKYLKDMKITYDKAFLDNIYNEFNSLASLADFQKWVNVIIEKAYTGIDQIHKSKNSMSIETVKTYISLHIGEEISLDKMGSLIDISPRYLSKLFKEETGIKFSDYVTSCRIKAAEKQLLSTDLKIEEISSNVGYFSTSHFIRKFKQHNGVTPSQYRSKRTL